MLDEVEAEVAAGFDPFIVLFGEDGADEPDQRGAVGEDPDHVGAAPDFPVEAFLRVVGPDLAPEAFGEGREREDVFPGGLDAVRDAGQLLGQDIEHAVELDVHAGGVGGHQYHPGQAAGSAHSPRSLWQLNHPSG